MFVYLLVHFGFLNFLSVPSRLQFQVFKGQKGLGMADLAILLTDPTRELGHTRRGFGTLSVH